MLFPQGWISGNPKGVGVIAVRNSRRHNFGWEDIPDNKSPVARKYLYSCSSQLWTWSWPLIDKKNLFFIWKLSCAWRERLCPELIKVGAESSAQNKAAVSWPKSPPILIILHGLRWPVIFGEKNWTNQEITKQQIRTELYLIDWWETSVTIYFPPFIWFKDWCWENLFLLQVLLSWIWFRVLFHSTFLISFYWRQC